MHNVTIAEIGIVACVCTSMSLRATGVTTNSAESNSSMSLQATGITTNNIDPNASMSLRATGVTADSINPNASMSLRTALPEWICCPPRAVFCAVVVCLCGLLQLS